MVLDLLCKINPKLCYPYLDSWLPYKEEVWGNRCAVLTKDTENTISGAYGQRRDLNVNGNNTKEKVEIPGAHIGEERKRRI